MLQLVDLHGDVMGTLPIGDGAGEADWAGLRLQAADEFGNPTDLTTGGTRVSTGAPPGRDGRYGWLGGKQRSADALAGVLLMGVRLYDPATGRFWSTDPEPGGNGTTYDYCTGDPVNCFDLDGTSFWSSVKKGLKVIAKVAEIASFIPGPIGAAAAGISAAAYAATGNKKAAIIMAATVGAALVGAGAAVAAAKWAGAAAKVGRVAAGGKSVRAVASTVRTSAPRATPVAVARPTRAIGGVITGYTRHGLQSAIVNFSRGGHRVSPRAILDAVRNPQRAYSEIARRTTRYEGRDAVVVVNQRGCVVTCWAKNRSGRR